jgi:hypothetical protein
MTMQSAGKFRKKPVVIEAMPYDGTVGAGGEIVDWVKRSDPPGTIGVVLTDISALYIETLEGRRRVAPGDWVIRGVQGEFYPCKSDIFAATYEPAE